VKSFPFSFDSLNCAIRGDSRGWCFGAIARSNLNNIAGQQQGGFCGVDDGEAVSHSTCDFEDREAICVARNFGEAVT
jgi:hypothetical protein